MIWALELTVFVQCYKKNNINYVVHYIKGKKDKKDKEETSENTGDFMVYVYNDVKNAYNVGSFRDSPRAPGRAAVGKGKWISDGENLYHWESREKDKRKYGNWTREDEIKEDGNGKSIVEPTYYYTPAMNVTPLRPLENKKTWKKIMDDVNKSLKEYKGDEYIETNRIPFKGTPPDLRVDFSHFQRGHELKVNLYCSDERRTFNFEEAENMYSKYSQERLEGNPHSPEEVKQYMIDNNLTWHEGEDGRTLMKIPTELHDNIPHNGGINAIKLRLRILN